MHDGGYMQRKLGAALAKALKLRVAELRRVSDLSDLLLGTGRWEQLSSDRAGQWSARLTANWRLIVEPDSGDSITVIVVEIVDYHRR